MNPTQSQSAAMGILATIFDSVRTFPFASRRDTIGWLAGMLTVAAHHELGAAPRPLFAITADAPATGKTRLVRLAADWAGAGRPPLVHEDAFDSVRQRDKVFHLAARDGMIAIDNGFGKGAQAAVLHAVTSEKCPGAIWTTGNHLAIGGDLARRTVAIRLVAFENPGQAIHEPRIVHGDAKRIIGLWKEAGSPVQGVRPWGSFERWTSTVAAICTWLEQLDPSESAWGK